MIYPPAGYVLFYRKCDFSVDSRYEKYMQFVNSGSAVIPITYIAEVLGITYTDAVCDLQEMASLGYLGTGAYVNYKERTLVLKNFSASGAARGTSYGGAGRSSGAQYNAPPRQNYSRQRVNRPPQAPIPKKKSKAPFRTLALVLGVIFLLTGVSVAAEGIDMVFWGYWSYMAEVIQGLFWTLAGGGLLTYNITAKNRDKRIEKYNQMFLGRKSMDLETISQYSLVPVGRVRRDLEYMIKNDLLQPGAHFSSDKRVIFLTGNFADAERPEPKTPPKTAPETPVEDRYAAIIREIRQLNDDIPDEAVSERIYKIEDITSKIFAIVKEHPEKEGEIKTFMSYYLPTTLKLLRSYSVFEKQGVSGENIDSTLKDIERILDTLVQGFSQQLDRMFQADALDISSDIEVLESMMKQDGLSGSSAFQIMPDSRGDLK